VYRSEPTVFVGVFRTAGIGFAAFAHNATGIVFLTYPHYRNVSKMLQKA
jgi:hypothetical protein